MRVDCNLLFSHSCLHSIVIMIQGIVLLFALVASAVAFTPAGRISSRSNNVVMQLFPESDLGIPGELAPVGFFDPLGLSNGKDEDTIKMYREVSCIY